MKLRSQGPASPVPDMTTARKKPVLKKQGEMPIMTRHGLVWQNFDCHGFVHWPKTVQAFDEATHNFIVVAGGNAITPPHGYACVMFTALCSTGIVFYAWVRYKQAQAQRNFRLRDLFIHSPDAGIYNGIYRTYRSTLELHSRFLFHLIFSGLEWPMMSTVAGMSWILARFFYVKAYLRGEPEERHWCWIDWLSFNFVRVGAIYYAFKRLL